MFILLSLGFGPVRLTINFNSPIRLHDTDNYEFQVTKITDGSFFFHMNRWNEPYERLGCQTIETMEIDKR